MIWAISIKSLTVGLTVILSASTDLKCSSDLIIITAWFIRQNLFCIGGKLTWQKLLISFLSFFWSADFGRVILSTSTSEMNVLKLGRYVGTSSFHKTLVNRSRMASSL